jgi:hypothetical protein
MKRTAWLAVALVLATLPTGCVTRRFVITSTPPGALVYRDGQPIGPTPVEQSFLYYGKYRFRLVKDGFEPLDVEPQLVSPWYEYPGVDFVTENLIPYNFRDKQVLNFELKPLTLAAPPDFRDRAVGLQTRAATIQPHTGPPVPLRPAEPSVPPAPPAVTPEPPVAPPAAPRLGPPTPLPTSP